MREGQKRTERKKETWRDRVQRRGGEKRETEKER